MRTCEVCGRCYSGATCVCTNPRCLSNIIAKDEQIVSIYNRCYSEAINIIFKDKSSAVGVAEDTIILLAVALFNKGFIGAKQ